jgi:hypothetical protein
MGHISSAITERIKVRNAGRFDGIKYGDIIHQKPRNAHCLMFHQLCHPMVRGPAQRQIDALPNIENSALGIKDKVDGRTTGQAPTLYKRERGQCEQGDSMGLNHLWPFCRHVSSLGEASQANPQSRTTTVRSNCACWRLPGPYRLPAYQWASEA